MRSFPELFRGREDAHGHYFSLAGRTPTERGKMVSKAESVHVAVTPELYQEHLTGKERLGIIPVMSDGCVWWSCIDIDFYRLNGKRLEDVGGYIKLAKAIRDTQLVITRSKSGGAHLWTFYDQPTKHTDAHAQALALLDKLKLWTVLGVSEKEFREHVDVFPKGLPDEKKNIGIWVNLPYFGDQCTAIGYEGESELKLSEFLTFASDRLVKQGVKQKKGPKSDAPPCIDYMIEHGVEEGHRDVAVTHYSVFAKQKWPDEWQEKVYEWNEENVHPPLRKDEVTKILNSAEKKDFFYLCKAIKAIYCDVDECKKRTYGVGKGAPVTDLGIDHIEKIDGENPIYLVTMGDKTFDCKLEQLFTYGGFRRRAMGALNRLIPPMKQPEWEEMLADHLQAMEVTEAASDTQMRDRVISAFQNWCGQCCVTEKFADAMKGNVPFYDGKTITFKGDALLSQLDRQLRVSRDDAYVYMRGWGTTIIEKDGEKLWCWLQRGPLWFDAYKGKQK